MKSERIDVELFNDLFHQLGIPFSRAKVSSRRYIYVHPDHELFWSQFKEKYPEWRRLAEGLGAVVDGKICPEFGREEDLLIWLTGVTKLPFILCLV